uniref:Uncharacterized protein n=1 Tax=Tetranychus urticae TaxID=32264 RepID=T1JRX8_TETUR
MMSIFLTFSWPLSILKFLISIKAAKLNFLKTNEETLIVIMLTRLLCQPK